MSLPAWSAATLEASIKKELEEEDADGGTQALDEKMDEIIQRGEDQLLLDLDLDIFSTTNTAMSMTSGQNTLGVPSDMVALKSVAYEPVGGGARTHLKPRTYEYLEAYWPNDASTGSPLYYCLLDTGAIMLAPTPDAAYPVAWRYLYRPASLTEGSATYLGTHYPAALLYACLIHAEIILFAEERVPVWEARYMAALPAHIRQQLKARRREPWRVRKNAEAKEEADA